MERETEKEMCIPSKGRKSARTSCLSYISSLNSFSFQCEINRLELRMFVVSKFNRSLVARNFGALLLFDYEKSSKPTSIGTSQFNMLRCLGVEINIDFVLTVEIRPAKLIGNQSLVRLTMKSRSVLIQRKGEDQLDLLINRQFTLNLIDVREDRTSCCNVRFDMELRIIELNLRN